MTRYQTNTSQFIFQSGEQRPPNGLLLVAEPKTLYSQEVRKGSLYIVAEADDSPRAEEACTLAINTIQRVFYEDNSLSVSSALRKAILRANRALYERNFGLAVSQRCYVGISCAVLKGDDILIAQVAPSQAYLASRGALRALPPHPSWNPAHVSVTPFVKPAAMGTSLFVEPEFFRSTVTSGDGIVLCSSNLSRLLSRQITQELMRGNDPAIAVERMVMLCRQNALPHAQGIVVWVVPYQQALPRMLPDANGKVGFVQSLLAWGSGLFSEGGQMMRQQREAQQEVSHGPIPADPAFVPPPANPVPLPRPIDIGPTLDERRIQQHVAVSPFAQGEEALPPSTFLGENSYVPTPPPSPVIDLSHAHEGRMVTLPRPAIKPFVDMTITERVMHPYFRLRDSLRRRAARRYERYLMPPGLPNTRRSLSYRRDESLFPWALFLLLVLLISGLVTYGYSLSQRQAVEETRSLLDEAERSMNAVRSSSGETQAIERLEMARQTLTQIASATTISETSTADWLRFQRIRQDFSSVEAGLLRLSTLEGIEVVAEHPSAGSVFSNVIIPSTETTSTAALAYIYALDTNAGVLYRIPYDGGTPTPFLKPNDEIQGVLVGNLLQAAWRTDTIVAADRNVGSNFYFRGNDGWFYSVLAGSEEWSRDRPFDMEGFLGNIYFWNAIKGQVLKYTAGNYGNLPTPWIIDTGGKDIENSLDMVIDGNLYLLQPNANVLVFDGGVMVREIVPTGVTPPLASVTRILSNGGPDGGSLFMVDTLNERIVQINKQTGQLIQQLRVAPDSSITFDRLSDLQLDSRSARPLLYIINGGQVLRVPLPAPPAPFKPAS